MNQDDDMTNWHPSKWVDYMEGELDWLEKKGMEWMFRHNRTHREILKNYMKLRRMVRKSDPIKDMPDNDKYYQQLHDKIMNAVGAEEMQELEEMETTSTQVLRMNR